VGVPAHMIGADPEYWLRALMSQLLGEGAGIGPEVVADYIRCFRDPEEPTPAPAFAPRRPLTLFTMPRPVPPGGSSSARSWSCGGRRARLRSALRPAAVRIRRSHQGSAEGPLRSQRSIQTGHGRLTRLPRIGGATTRGRTTSFSSPWESLAWWVVLARSRGDAPVVRTRQRSGAATFDAGPRDRLARVERDVGWACGRVADAERGLKGRALSGAPGDG
jgi:hypothetical protein